MASAEEPELYRQELCRQVEDFLSRVEGERAEASGG